MGMSVSHHVNSSEKVEVRSYATVSPTGKEFAVLSVEAGAGHDLSSVTMFLSLHNIERLEDALAQAKHELLELQKKRIHQE
jgi:hypothetical protein